MKQAKYLQVEAHVRYSEDAQINGVADEKGDLMPFLSGELWKPLIDISSGEILEWPQDAVAEVHYKVCDSGRYFVLDADKNVIGEINKDGYVPECLYPKRNGYGDYIIMDIDQKGFIQGWDTEVFNEDLVGDFETE